MNQSNLDFDALLRRHRKGDEHALNILVDNLMRMRKQNIAIIHNEFTYLFSNEDLEDIYLDAVFAATRTFVPGKGRFLGYFRLILSRTIIKNGVRRIRERSHLFVSSLDEVVGDDLSLHDVLPNLDCFSNPGNVFSYQEMSNSLEKVTIKNLIKRYMAEDVSSGMSVEEVASKYGVSIKKVKNNIYCYRKKAKEVVDSFKK